jgi:hypothetical protein
VNVVDRILSHPGRPLGTEMLLPPLGYELTVSWLVPSARCDFDPDLLAVLTVSWNWKGREGYEKWRHVRIDVTFTRAEADREDFKVLARHKLTVAAAALPKTLERKEKAAAKRKAEAADAA